MNVLLPLLMFMMMFTMGLTLSKPDFVRIVEMPRAIITGSICQLLILPVLGLLIARIFGLSDTLLMGFMVLCACPGGILSNYISFSAKGDMALSVSLTLVSSIVCVFSVPIIINLTQQFLSMERTVVSLPIMDTMRSIALITVLPISLGMLFVYKYPALGGRLSRTLSTFCSLALIGYILYLWHLQQDAIISAAKEVGLPVLALVVCASTMAWAVGVFVNLAYRQKITLVIETGIQNSALAFTVTAVILNNELFAIPTIFYSVAMFLPALLLIFFGRKLNGLVSAPEL